MLGVLKDLRDAGFTEAQIQAMTLPEMLGAYLKWNGIVGYTDRILAIVSEFEGVPFGCHR